MWAVRSRLDHLVKYVSNKEKTTLTQTVNDKTTDNVMSIEQQLVTCINCMQNDPYTSMVCTKNLFHDDKEILCFHGYQSFVEDEVTPLQAHQIGIELAEKLWGDRYEVIVSTHLDQENIHNHFLLNSTSYVNGKRFCNTKHDRHMMMNTSDKLCCENGLSVIEEKEHRSQSRGQYRNEQSVRSKVKKDIDELIKVSFTETQFFNHLEFEGYEIKRMNNNVSLRHPQHKKFIRLSSLGEDYRREYIIDKIMKNEMHQLEKNTIYEQKGFDITPYYQKYKMKKLTGFQRLYLHYQYKLGIIPRRSNTRPKYTKELREAIRKIDEISNQTILLCEHNIETLRQLEQYQEPLEAQLNKLINLRQQCYYKIRRCRDNDTKDNYKAEAKSYTPQIRKLGKEIKLCEGVKERSSKIKHLDLDKNERQYAAKRTRT